MRKIMLMAFVASVVALMLAASPASADHRDDCELVWDPFDEELVLVCEDDGFDDGLLLLVDDGRFIDDGCFIDFWGFLVCPDNGFFFGDGGLAVELGDVTSGDVTFDTTVTNSGDNSNQAAPILNAANTGNVQNIQGFSFIGGEVDDIEVSGGSINVSPSLDFSADQSVEQSALVVR